MSDDEAKKSYSHIFRWFNYLSKQKEFSATGGPGSTKQSKKTAQKTSQVLMRTFINNFSSNIDMLFSMENHCPRFD